MVGCAHEALDMDEIRLGACREVGWKRVTRGVYRREVAVEGAVPAVTNGGAAIAHADLRAWQQVLPSEASFTHLTAAWLRGWWVPALADVPVFAVTSRGPRVRRAGLRVTRLGATPAYDLIAGLRVAEPSEVLIACARDLGPVDLVPLLDSAARDGVELTRLAPGGGRHGAAALSRAIALADARAESPWESILRLQHRAFGVEVVPQHVVEDERGFVARGDLWVAGTRTLQEYDGAVHLTRAQQQADLRRQRRLNEAGWTRNGYTAADVVRRPHVVLRDVDRALGRTHESSRIEAWRTLLRESSLTAPGRARLRERWGRGSGQ